MMSIKAEPSSPSSFPSMRLDSFSSSQSISVQLSITSIASTSSIKVESSGHDSNSSTPRRTPRTSAKRKRNRDYRTDSSIYVVSRILARSFDQATSANRKLEYQYLVRWEGYGPKDDTWENRSSLLMGASVLVKEFESKPHPFTILDSRKTKPPTYLVRYGESFEVEPSPMYAEEWHNVTEMREIGGLDKETIIRAIKDHNNGVHPKRTASLRTTKLQKERCILAILERNHYKAKYNSKTLSAAYLVRWREKRSIKEEWLTYGNISNKFGEDGRRFLKAWNEEMGFGVQKKKEQGPVTPVSEYEQERLLNMEANKDLMKQLGL